MKIGLVMPVLNTFDLAVDAIYSAKSKNELKVFIQPQYRYQVPLAQAWNNGVRQAMKDNCDVIIISNDDVIFAPYTIDHLSEQFLYEHDEEGVLMAYPLDVFERLEDPSDILFDDGEQYGNFLSYGTEVSGIEDKEDQKFSCFAITPDFFEHCGTFDENFDPCWWEDTDMKYRMHLLGLEPLYTDIPYVHLRHQTTQRLTIPINSLKSQQYYEKKWGSARKDLKEAYINPYNDASLSAREWRRV